MFMDTEIPGAILIHDSTIAALSFSYIVSLIINTKISNYHLAINKI